MAKLRIHVVRLIASALVVTFLTGCASTSHVTAFQERPIAPPPRSLALALDADEALPFGLSADMVATAAAAAGYGMDQGGARYRLSLTGAVSSSGAGSYLPAAETKASPSWVARPNRNWRARLSGGTMLRISAVLIDGTDNKEVWRGTGTLRTDRPQEDAAQLAREILAKLPHS